MRAWLRQLRLLGQVLRVQWRAARGPSAIAMAVTVVQGSVTAIAAWLTKALVDELARGSAMDRHVVTIVAIWGAAVTAAASVAYHVLSYLDSTIRGRIGLYVERELFAKVLRLDELRYFEDARFHAKIRLASEAASSAPQQSAELVQTALRTVVMIGSLAGIVVTIWAPMAALLVVVGAIAVTAEIVWIRHQVRLAQRMVQVYRWRDFFRALLVDPRAAKEIRLFGSGPLLHDRLMKRLETVTWRGLDSERAASWVQIGLAVIAAVVTVVGTVVVVGRVADHELAIGDVVLFTSAVAGIQGSFLGLVNQLGRTGPTLLMFRAYTEVLALPERSAALAAPPPLSVGIELRDVWFRYTPDGPWVLRGLDLMIPAGRAIAIVGHNGAGKSTLIKLLGRFYDPERGTITWDGVDIRTLDPARLRERVAAVFQDYMTYDLSAAENIGIGDHRRFDDLARIRQVAGLAHIDDTLAALPDGYRTLLSRVMATGESGGDGEDHDASELAAAVQLSGGQWQRVALARCLMRGDAALMILDEPSSGLDPDAEHQLHDMLSRHASAKTRLLVSHRLGAVRDADVIAVLSDGAIVESGTHDQLMLRAGAYARMFTTQAAGYQDTRVQAGVAG